MKFWEKFKKLVSIRDLVFISIIFVLVFVFSFIEAANKVKVDFGEDALTVKSSRYAMTVGYDEIVSSEYLLLPEGGELLEGKDDTTVRTGHWKNDTWGEYYICADLAAEHCIVLHLDDGSTYVFSRRSSDMTQELFQELQTHIAK